VESARRFRKHVFKILSVLGFAAGLAQRSKKSIFLKQRKEAPLLICKSNSILFDLPAPVIPRGMLKSAAQSTLIPATAFSN